MPLIHEDLFIGWGRGDMLAMLATWKGGGGGETTETASSHNNTVNFLQRLDGAGVYGATDKRGGACEGGL